VTAGRAGQVVILQGDTGRLPLPDDSVDLIITSPPYWQLRTYFDGAAPCPGQLGNEDSPQDYLARLWQCTREWVRVLKPGGSLFVNLGDRYSTGNSGDSRLAEVSAAMWAGGGHSDARARQHSTAVPGVPPKGLLGLPWRYAIGCTDRLGLILRAEIVWRKKNGLPESVTDRVRREHEQVYHFVTRPRYYAAVDEIRQPHAAASLARSRRARHAGDRFSPGEPNTLNPAQFTHPGGKLPGSVWDIASSPLAIPDRVAHASCCGGTRRDGCDRGLAHYAAFPPELARRINLGRSPPGICTDCGQGRRPVTYDRQGRTTNGPRSLARRHESPGREVRAVRSATITGYACACTPYTDHRERQRPSVTPGRVLGRGCQDNAARAAAAGSRHHGNDWPPRRPVRDYHLDRWAPPPAGPAVVLDPCGGTGTTALAASVLGRTGITIDRSLDYCRLAAWRTTDPGQRARAREDSRTPPAWSLPAPQ
jgi:DNA modification methylase